MRVYYITLLLFILFVNSSSSSYAWSHSPHRWFTKTRSSRLNKPNHVFKDMPTQSDLKIYLKALERVVDFSSMNKMDIDMNYAFGLFLINVNLKTVLRHRPMNIPLLILQPIRQLVKKNTELLDFFRKMVARDRTKGNAQNKAIYSLFSNDTSWVERLDKYDAVFQTEKRKSSLTYLRAKFGNWELYTKRIFDWEKTAIPGPKASDYCAGMLEKCHTTVSDFRVKCVLPEECVNVLLDGTDAGYALTHRLLFIILAHYGRGCDVFSHTLDKKLTTQYCSDAFNEAQYIAFHQYGINDLLMEEMLFCGMLGHTQFIKRSWLRQILKLQTNFGCFSKYPKIKRWKRLTRRRKRISSYKWTMLANERSRPLAGGFCHRHTTSVTAGALAVAIKFLLQLYY